MNSIANPLRVVLLHKRYMPLDERIVQLLETQLSQRGIHVFTDRQSPVGIEWAKSIEARIQGAEAVIPILSPGAVQSEMMAYELEMAAEAAQRPGGLPRLLPVLVKFSGSLPDALSASLDGEEARVWDGPEDDSRLVAGLIEALANVPPAGPGSLPGSIPASQQTVGPGGGALNAMKPGLRTKPAKLEPVGGAVPLDSEFYLVRPQDGELRVALTRHDSIVLIKGARQMGKTSLLARGLQQARERGAKVVLTDLQKLNVSELETPTRLYLALAEAIAEQLDLEVLPERVWDDRRGPNTNLERYLRREVLGKLNAPLVWGLDEVDRLFSCSFGSEVFGLFRSWHNERALDPTGPWAGLTLAIAYATEAHLFISDMNQSPFNVGTRLALEDFAPEQVAELNRRYGSPLADAGELHRLVEWLNGHPFLARRALHEMVTQSLDWKKLEAQMDQEEGIFGDHLRRILILLARDPKLMDVIRGVLRGAPCPNSESFYRLRSAGLIAGAGPGEVRMRCQLYASYLRRHLC